MLGSTIRKLECVRSVNGNNDQRLGLSNNNTHIEWWGYWVIKLNMAEKPVHLLQLTRLQEQSSSFTYVYGGDLNGDRINGNDLLFVPRKESDLRFVPISQNLGGSSQFFYTHNKKLLINLLIKMHTCLLKEVNMSIETRIFYLCYIELIYRSHKIFH
jgi:hypothetical protein